jgi:hypothetical protein
MTRVASILQVRARRDLRELGPRTADFGSVARLRLRAYRRQMGKPTRRMLDSSHMTEDIFLKPPVLGRVVNWLGPQMGRRLLDFAQTHRDGFRASSVGRANDGTKRIDLTIRRSYKLKFSGELRDELERGARAALPEMCRQLGSGQFEPSRFEIEMVAHGDGAFFTEHRDRLMGPTLRRRLISAVYYFHRLPKSFSAVSYASIRSPAAKNPKLLLK